MSGESINNGNRSEAEKPAWKVERERDLARKRRIGEAAIGLAAAVLVGVALSHSAKTSEIMNNEERAKNVKKIEVEAIAFHDGVNARKEPHVGDLEPNQLASIGEEGESVVIDYEGDGYYYKNEEDVNGGWYGFDGAQLSEELVEANYDLSQVEAEQLKGDEKYGDGVVWFNENYVTVYQPSETSD